MAIYTRMGSEVKIVGAEWEMDEGERVQVWIRCQYVDKSLATKLGEREYRILEFRATNGFEEIAEAIEAAAPGIMTES